MPAPLWQRAAALAAWLVVWQLAAMGLGHGGLCLATPLRTLWARAQRGPRAAGWRRDVVGALR